MYKAEVKALNHFTADTPRNFAATLRKYQNNSEKARCLHVQDTEEKKKGRKNIKKNKPTSQLTIWSCRDPKDLNKQIRTKKFLPLQGETLLGGQQRNRA